MKKNVLRVLLLSILLVLLVIALSNPISVVPPLGKLLNPFIGIVQCENIKNAETALHIKGVQDEVHVYVDERKVPHIFSKNAHDLYLAQGYVTARDRLWQMDFISYVSAGRLAELFGEKFLNYDRKQRRLGMLSSAKKTLDVIEKNEETKTALDAYTQGVNAYISSLSYKSFPFEYKLLDYAPEPWTNLKSVLILKYMGTMLSGYDEDVSMTHTLLALGRTAFEKLYPECALPGVKDAALNKLQTDSLPYPGYINYSFLSRNKVKPSDYNSKLGSNNWAVAGSRSVTGNPILCNDPHLGLSLPCIWYEIQLVSNDVNVYGVSIPGTTGVIIGFNKDIAWGVTNGSTDVKDWYKLLLKADYSKYLWESKWIPTKINTEEIKVKGAPVFTDTIYSTIHGPIVCDNKFNQTPEIKDLAMRWTISEPGNEFLCFLHLNKARNYRDFREAMRHYKCPIQNFVFASVDNDIAIRQQGLMYRKWNKQGRFILDGTKLQHLTREEVSDADLPSAWNPISGFVFSANNYPLFDTMDTYNTGYYAESRGMRIRERLSAKKLFSAEDMKSMQLDNHDVLAELVLPEMLNAIRNHQRKMNVCNATADMLAKWDGSYSKSSMEANLFNEWWNNLKAMTWDELRNQDYYQRDPDDLVLCQLIRDEKGSRYFDRVDTDSIEDFKSIALESFTKTMSTFNHQVWGEKNKVNFTHLLKIGPLSRLKQPCVGYSEALNAVSPDWGPSWRMVVELGKRPKAWGVYPGGQSGNPASDQYQRFIDDWLKGNYYELIYLLNEEEVHTQGKTFTELQLLKE